MAVAGIPSEIWPNNGLATRGSSSVRPRWPWPPSRCTSARPTGDGRSAPSRRSSSSPWPRCHWHRRRRHPCRRVPAPGHGPGPAAETLRLGCRLRHRLGHEVHRLAVRCLGAVRRAWAQGERRPLSMLAGMIVVAVPRFPLRLARPVRVDRRRRAFPARVEQDPDHGRECAARSRTGERIPVAEPGLPLAVGIVLAVLLARHLSAHPAHRGRGLHDRRCRDVGAHPARPGSAVGYLLYPINFFVWAYLLAEPTPPSDLLPVDTKAGSSGLSRTDRPPGPASWGRSW